MISIVICDDEIPFLDTLEDYIQKYRIYKSMDLKLTRFHDGSDLVENYNLGFDIIFLDISMAGLNGIETARRIREIDKQVIIIFLTSVIKYALTGYTLGAVNYIIKPITFRKLASELDAAILKCNEIDQQYITLKNNEGIFKLYVNDIKYIETYNRNTMIYTKDKNVICFHSMKKLEKKLEAFSFIRCHSSFIVNVKYIESVEKLMITLISSEHIPISQQKRKDVMKLIAIYLGGEL